MLGKRASLTEYPKKLQNCRDAGQKHAGSPTSTCMWMASLDFLDAHLKIAEPNSGYPIGCKLPKSIGCKHLICCQFFQLWMYSPQRIEATHKSMTFYLSIFSSIAWSWSRIVQNLGTWILQFIKVFLFCRQFSKWSFIRPSNCVIIQCHKSLIDITYSNSQDR